MHQEEVQTILHRKNVEFEELNSQRIEQLNAVSKEKSDEISELQTTMNAQSNELTTQLEQQRLVNMELTGDNHKQEVELKQFSQ
jgi:hypothetical protein